MQHGWKVKEANDKQRQLEQKEARKQTLAADERVVEAMKQRRDTSRTRKEVLPAWVSFPDRSFLTHSRIDRHD